MYRRTIGDITRTYLGRGKASSEALSDWPEVTQPSRTNKIPRYYILRSHQIGQLWELLSVKPGECWLGSGREGPSPPLSSPQPEVWDHMRPCPEP